jgi:alginate O-acetyltransferase complex protein AlgI
VVFNSLDFALFAALTYPTYYLLASWPARTRWLLIASWLFYASWSPHFLVLLVATTWVDFGFAKRIHRARVAGTPAALHHARRLVATSVVMNLGVLAFFKYGRFLYEQVALLVALPPAPAFLATAPPLGISFYTFHSLSYIIDTYRGLRPPAFVFGEFALYVAFFPQLIAGPITRWTFLGPQIQSPRRVSEDDWERGLFLIAKGLVKKVVLADALGGLVDGVYQHVDSAAALEIAIALYAYAFQIYFDFSGYTDIALGLARLLGFRLPQNFRHPYRARDPRDFWQRWHISLSTWLRDYLYISLGGNRRGTARMYANLLVTMVLGGLWHGAAWNFVLWGAFHGLWLVAHRAVASTRPPRTPAWLRGFVTFHLVVAAWVLFRAPSLETVAAIGRGLVSTRPMLDPFPLGVVLILLIGALSHGLAARLDLERRWLHAPRIVQGAALGAVIVLVGVFSAQSQRFIYFQF